MPIRHCDGLGLVVRDVHGGDRQLLLDLPQLELHGLAHLEVERSQRLVHQQHLRRECDGAGQRDPLLLTAGEFRGKALRDVRQPDQVEEFRDPRVDPIAGNFALDQAEADVLADRQMREQRVVLEHHADRAFLRRQAGHVVAADQQAAGGWLHEAGDHA